MKRITLCLWAVTLSLVMLFGIRSCCYNDKPLMIIKIEMDPVTFKETEK